MKHSILPSCGVAAAIAISASAFTTSDIQAEPYDTFLGLPLTYIGHSDGHKSQFGISQQEIRDFFDASIAGKKPIYNGMGENLTASELDAARDYIWSIWKEAVKAEKGEHLPPLSQYKDLKWGEISVPADSWQLPEGEMKYFFGAKGEKPEGGYPLFLFIHGSGEDNQREWTVSKAWAQRFEDTPSAYFIPRSPKGGTGTRWYQPSRQEKWERIIRQAFASDDIDPSKFYIMGISEGGYGSQRLASYYTDYLAGAGPIAGGEILYNCPPENLANTAFTLQTGDEDTMFGRRLLTMRVNHLLDSLQAAHPGMYEHKVDLQPGRGHGCDYTITTPWLAKHTRNANPKYFHWENYGMGGINGEPIRYRDTFHNLQILEPSDPRNDDMLRTTYVIEINGNTIDLNVDNVRLTPAEKTDVHGFSIPLAVQKEYTPATSGKVRVWLNEELVDFGKPVKIRVNGETKFEGMAEPTVGDMVESAALFYDPMRVYPASVEVNIGGK